MVCLKMLEKTKKLANWNKWTNNLLNIASCYLLYKKHLSTYTHASTPPLFKKNKKSWYNEHRQ
jgi:hypothetical protein